MNPKEQKNYLNEMNDAIIDLKFYLANQEFLPDLNQNSVAKLGRHFERIGQLIQVVAKKQSQK